ncbi:MAG: hypothetical protein J2P36_39160 [Ktedonobacteraceae bacterium]|nr:hypothetical protein [Ktedonobacteraceae bacterium]
MYPDTTVTIKRGVQVLYQQIDAQIDLSTLSEGLELGGESPANAYRIYLLTGDDLGLQLGDLLVDERTNLIDPTTHMSPAYRLVGEPHYYAQDGHTQLFAQKTIGTPN